MGSSESYIMLLKCTKFRERKVIMNDPYLSFLVPFISQELFVKVVPFHCLGCIWSQRDKKENRDLAPTVRATISQFNAVTNCVITSLLCPPATSAPSSLSSPQSSPTQRAKIIEMWISVAQVCINLAILII